MPVHNKMYDKNDKRHSDEKSKKPTVMVSGGFDPVHAGHIRMIRDAANFGEVVVVANSDDWLFRKKGFVFMTFAQRAEILNAIKGVILVDSVDDTDGTVCEAIRRIKPDFFANGGDRGRTNTPEVDVCNEMEIKLLWGVGGDKKMASSSDLVKNSRTFESAPIRARAKHSDR
jgi:D-beta-D-heptose 7-phosphate kinase/D-beta-D-heptose 1-phosphate adenosyltransferase